MKYMMKCGEAKRIVEAPSEAEAREKMDALIADDKAPGFSEGDTITCEEMAPGENGGQGGQNNTPMAKGMHFGGYLSGNGGMAHRGAGPSGRFERNMRPTEQGYVDPNTGMGPAKMRPGDLARRGAAAMVPAMGYPAAHRSQAVPEPGRYIGDDADPVTLDPKAGEGYIDPRTIDGSVQYAEPGHASGPVVTQQMIDDGTAPPAHASIAGDGETGDNDDEQSSGGSDPSPAQNGKRNGRRAPAAAAA